MAHDDLIFRAFDVDQAQEAGLAEPFVQAVLRGFHEDRADTAHVERWLRHGRADDMVMRGAWLAAPTLGSADLPVATFASLAGEINVGAGARLPAHLVTDVTVSPAHRRRGLLRRLMTDDLDDAVAKGRPLAALLVSEGTIYGRFGFGPATRIRNVEVDTSSRFRLRAEAPTSEGRLELLDPTEAGDIADALFARLHETTRGSVARPDFYRMFVHEVLDWETRSRDNKAQACVLLGPDDRPEGYVLYRHDGDQDGRATVRVRDLLAADTAAYLRLWRFLAEIDLAERVTWNRGPIDDPLPWALADPRLVRTVRESDLLWVRVLDVVTALEARPWGADGAVVLDVDDTLGHAAGRWRVEVADGQASVARTEEVADVHLDAETLGALYLGGVDTSTLATAGRLRGSSEALAAWAAMADVGPLPYCTTGF